MCEEKYDLSKILISKSCCNVSIVQKYYSINNIMQKMLAILFILYFCFVYCLFVCRLHHPSQYANTENNLL